MAFEKVLTNLTNGKIYINWSYETSTKTRNGNIELLPREIKTCTFIDEQDYKQMARQNEEFYLSKKIIDSKISDSKKDQLAEEREKKEHDTLKKNSKEENIIEKDVKDAKGKKIGVVRTQEQEQ